MQSKQSLEVIHQLYSWIWRLLAEYYWASYLVNLESMISEIPYGS